MSTDPLRVTADWEGGVLPFRQRSGVSSEALSLELALQRLMAATEGTQAWFGAKAEAIASLRDVEAECADIGWDGADAQPVDNAAARRAEALIRAWPDDVRLPEVAAEPDGAISLDWVRSRHRVFSVSVGPRDRLAYAWIDGADRGHGAVGFDGETAPPRIVDGVRRLFVDRDAPLRAR